jgi:hypothetical protein
MQKEEYPIKIVEENGIEYVFDNIRKKYVVLSPEEWVRQEMIKFFIENCFYPKACISVEKTIAIGDKKMRYDILIFLKTTPWLLVECKSPEIELTAETFFQSTAYQNVVQAKYIILCNGEKTICYNTTEQKWEESMPDWPI